MKVALIADTFPPLRTFGAVQLRDLSREFVRHGHELTVLLAMARAVSAWHRREMPVALLPFRNHANAVPKKEGVWNFVYVSDGVPHKNHDRLMHASELLEWDFLKPTLVLTLGPRDQELVFRV